MTGIIAAMDKELEGLLAHIKKPMSEEIAGIRFVSGSICGKDVVCAVCGIGKVNAAVCAGTMILKYDPDEIINTGVGGALDKELHVCDVVCAEYAVQHDMDTTALGDPPGFVSTVNTLRFPVDEELSARLCAAMQRAGVQPKRGGVASGDRFVCKAEDKSYIRDTFSCRICEMEGAAIAHACYMFKKPCAILRAVSDGADEDAGMSYTEFAGKAAEMSVKVLMEYLGA